MPRIILSIIILLGGVVNCYSQSDKADSLKQLLIGKTGIEEIELLHQIHGAVVNMNPDSAIRYAQLAFNSSFQLNDPEVHTQSYFNLGHAMYVNGMNEEFRALLLEAVEYVKGTSAEKRLSQIYRNLSVYGEVTGQPDSTLYFIDKCIAALEEYPDSSTLGDAFLSKGFAYRVKGYYNLSIEALLNALRIFDDVGSPNQKGYAYLNIGIAHALADRLEEAIDFMNNACDQFLLQENIWACAQAKNNVGLWSGQLGMDQEAIENHHQSIVYSKQTGQIPVLMNNYWNIGRLYMESEILDSSLYYLEQAFELGQQIQDSFIMGGDWRKKALIFAENRSLGNPTNAFNESLNFPASYNNPTFDLELREDQAAYYEMVNNSKSALESWKAFTELKDSIFTIEKDQQLAELNLIYETEKKDAEIKLLEKNATISQLRIKGLTIGLLLSILAGMSIVYALRLKRKKDRIIHENQQKLSREKRKSLEQQIEFKNKELTSKALQLAKKNEFLTSLGKEVKAVKSKVDAEVNKTSYKLSKMIESATDDAEEWAQFTKEFTSVHKDFLARLKQKHGNFSKNEMRLIALMKMNLNSKNIADILNISSEGIKKARYRLRKKLELASEVDLQGYLLAI